MKIREKFAAWLDQLLQFFDLRRHYPSNYFYFDTLLHKPKDFEFLLEVPSQTTIRERLFLYNFFHNNWHGGKVLEIGPFIGGTTRSIAMGMLDSKFGNSSKKLLTIDKFDTYVSSDTLTKMGVSKSIIDKNSEQSSDALIPFRKIFDFYTINQSYSSLVEVIDFRIPEFENDIYSSDAMSQILEFSGKDSHLECIFVDGAKSYYALRFILCNLADSINCGTRLIFQDYMKISCWWIPLIMGSLSQFFRVEYIIDSTVSLVCVKPSLQKYLLSSNLPNTVQEFSESQIQSSFHSEIAKEVSKYSKKFRTITSNQRQAAFTDYGIRLRVATLENLKESIRTFPRTWTYITQTKNVIKGTYNQ